MEYSTWSRRIAELAGASARLEAEALAVGAGPEESASWRVHLHQKLAPQAAGAPYLIVAVAGGTNIGKSTVFNHLVGFSASRVHPDATQTKHPVCMLPQGFAARHDLRRVFPRFRLEPWSSEDDALGDGPSDLLIHREDPTGAQPSNLVLLDTPDVDGAIPVNWDRARLIAHAADVLIVVLTQQKYNDAAVRRFFREAADADKTILAVFNMVEWPEERPFLDGWLATFCKGAGVRPSHVYAVPRDRAAVRDNRLAFHPLTEGSTDPRLDLADLRFAEIKIRSLRGALRRMLDPADGLPAFLRRLQARADENREARAVIHQKVQVKIDAPELPGHIVGDVVWQWLEPRRTWFDRKVHDVYGKLGRAVVRLLPGRREPAEEEAAFIEAERTQWTRALENVYHELEMVHQVGAPALRQELQPLIAGDQRRRAFEELDQRLAATPLATAAYRRAIAERLERFEAEHPRMMRAIEWGLVATAVIRPAITIGMFGAADVAAHGVLQLGTHSMGQIFFDVAAGSAMTAGGEGAFARLGGPAQKLIADLFAEFYRERAELLAGVLNDCVIGDRLDRIERLAAVAETDDFKTVYRIAGELSRELAAWDEDAAAATAEETGSAAESSVSAGA